MAMRTCRYPLCGKAFEPAQPHYWHCSWEHYLADKERKGHPLYDAGFRADYVAGLDAGRQHTTVPPLVFKAAIALVHPDRYQDSPLVCAANTVTRWLIEHRAPPDVERN